MAPPPVKKAHIVPRAWLRRFALDDQLTVHLTDTGSTHTGSINDVAVRRYFYRRTDEEGEPLDDVEHELALVGLEPTTS